MHLSDTSKVIVNYTENFLENFEKVLAQNMKLCQNILTPSGASFLPHFFELKLFSKVSRNFSMDFTNIFKASERST